jgi:hypothetical protein
MRAALEPVGVVRPGLALGFALFDRMAREVAENL